jgi:hypothetical protein
MRETLREGKRVRTCLTSTRSNISCTIIHSAIRTLYNLLFLHNHKLRAHLVNIDMDDVT